MAINQSRYEQFRTDIAALMRQVSPIEQIRTFEAKVMNLLAREDTSPENMSRVKRLVQDLFSEEMAPFKERLFSKFGDVLEVVNTLYNDLPLEVSRDMIRIRAIEMANAAELGDYEDTVADAIRRQVRESSAQGERLKELQERIHKVGDKAEVYARTLARTQMKTIARAGKAEKARIAGVVYYEYVGVARPTTRDFCLDLLGQTLHIDSIHKLRNGNKEPVLIHCGGWNCAHDWEPDPFATEESTGAEEAAEESQAAID